MSGGASTTAQRLRLEALATKAVYDLLALPCPVASLAVLQSSSSPVPSTKRSRPSASSASATSEVKLSALDRALRQFFDKLPYNHGAQLCIEDVLGHVRKLVSAKNNNTNPLSEVVRYLESPGFVEHLAAFGRLPNHPYILAFDPYAYQSKPPPTEEASKKFDPVAFEECANGGSGNNTMMPSRAELEALDKELENIFEEKLSGGRLKCPKCQESKFVHFHEEQRRSADEGSSYVFYCGNCGHTGRAR